MNEWFAQVKAWPVAEVAARFGRPVQRKGPDVSFPCPACGKERRHTKGTDQRAAAKVVNEGGWWCEPCDAGGDAVSLAAACVTGRLKPASPDGWREVRRECAALGLCEADPRDTTAPTGRKYEPPPPELRTKQTPARAPAPATEVRRLWDASERLGALPVWDGWEEDGSWCGDARAFLTARGLSPARLAALDVARILPPAAHHAWPGWWPAWWSTSWRLAVPLYGLGAELVGLQARAIDGADPKTRNPKDVSMGGGFFADASGLEVLRGTWGGGAVVLVEGLTDFLSAAQLAADLEPNRRPAVLGLVAGSAQALATMKLEASCRLVVMSDNDATGEKYFEQVKKALPGLSGVRVRLLPLGDKRADLNDYLRQHPAHALAALTYGMKGGTHGG